MRPKRSVSLSLILALALMTAPGCSDPLIRAKDLFTQGAARGDFGGTRLEELKQAATRVMGRKDRYGDEGMAQAALMLAYAYVWAGQFDRADEVIGQLELATDATKISSASQALLVIVMADSSYQRFLDLAAADMCANAAEMEKRLGAAVEAYDAAISSGAFASKPTLRQLFALREADILLSAGDLWAEWDLLRARDLYSRALEVATEASKLDAALRKELLERAADAQERPRSHSEIRVGPVGR
jgi:hypothetical protein